MIIVEVAPVFIYLIMNSDLISKFFFAIKWQIQM